jgi:4-hydroxy-tetrahydrodipicolinate synthase
LRTDDGESFLSKPVAHTVSFYPMRRGAILVALLTPFTPGGEIDTEAMLRHVAELRAAGVDGFFVCGTTGEGPLLDDEEVLLITRSVLSSCDGACRVIAQVGRASTKATLRLLDRVLDAGAHGVTAVTPYYYELDRGQMEMHYRALISSSGDRPVYAYVIPRRAGNDLLPELAQELAGLGLAGIKDSTRSLERHLEYLQIAAAPKLNGFEVYMGTDGLAVEAFKRGSTGIVSAIANLRPDLFVSLRAAIFEGRAAQAFEYQSEIELLRQSLGHRGTISRLKSAVKERLVNRGVDYPVALKAPLGAVV